MTNYDTSHKENMTVYGAEKVFRFRPAGIKRVWILKRVFGDVLLCSHRNGG
jgi:hypothetical protein